MAVTRALVRAPLDTVFEILADPPAYKDFVVGNKQVRSFEPEWPQVGSKFHHTLGIGPIVMRDYSEVTEIEGRRRLVMAARMMPFAVNRVAFTLREVPEGTEVEVDEKPVEGLEAVVWNPVFDGIMWLRNREMLRRLDRLAARRVAARDGSAGKDGSAEG